MHKTAPLLILALLFSTESFAQRYSYLDRLEKPVKGWAPEKAKKPVNSLDFQQLDVDLSAYHEEFREDGKITIYLGMGQDAWHTGRPRELRDMIGALAQAEGVELEGLALSSSGVITFKDKASSTLFRVQVGHERNEFARAFASNEVVMYHGHSRYGRGPSFDGFTNYFRMGDVFSSIEVDTRNRYFERERILFQDTYPLQSVNLEGREYSFQYRGQLSESSYLPSDAYTKIIEGGDKDLRAARFLSGRQLLWLYSCKNLYYWRDSIRARFPDDGSKFVFGTDEDSYWSGKPAAVFILSLVRGVAESAEIVTSLNAIGDCAQCWTSY